MELLLMQMATLPHHLAIQALTLEAIIITKLGHMLQMVDGQAAETKVHQEVMQ